MSTNFLFDANGKIHSYYLPTEGFSTFSVEAGTAINVETTVVDTATTYTVSNLQTYTGDDNIIVTQSGDAFLFSGTGFDGTVLTAGQGIQITILDGNIYQISNAMEFTGVGTVEITQEGNNIIANIFSHPSSVTGENETISVALVGPSGTTYLVSNNLNFTTTSGEGAVGITQNGTEWIFEHNYTSAIVTSDDTINIALSGDLVEVSALITLTSSNEEKLTITQDGPVNILTVTDVTYEATGATESIYVVVTDSAGVMTYIGYMAGVTGDDVQFTGTETDAQYVINIPDVVNGTGAFVTLVDDNYLIARTLNEPGNNIYFTDSNPLLIGQRNSTTYFLANRELQVTGFTMGVPEPQKFGNITDGVLNTSGFDLAVSSLAYPGTDAFHQIMKFISINANLGDGTAGTLQYYIVIEHNNDFASYTFETVTYYDLPSYFVIFQNLQHVSGAYQFLANPGDICTISLVPPPIE